MVAALYGELEGNELRELEAEIEADEDLRRDWQELREARTALGVLDREPQGRMEFELPPARPAAEAPAEVVPFARRLLPVAAGFAAAALIFAGLLVAGLRLDWVDAGMMVSFGRSGADRTAMSDSEVPGDEIRLSRTELASLVQLMSDATSARIDDLERRQTATTNQVARALYDAIAVRQQQQYNDLRARIDYAALRSGRANPSLHDSQLDDRRKKEQGNDYD